MIEESGLSFAEHTYEEQAGLLEENGITRVPTVAWVPADGGDGWAAEGVPTARSLDRTVRASYRSGACSPVYVAQRPLRRS